MKHSFCSDFSSWKKWERWFSSRSTFSCPVSIQAPHQDHRHLLSHLREYRLGIFCCNNNKRRYCHYRCEEQQRQRWRQQRRCRPHMDVWHDIKPSSVDPLPKLVNANTVINVNFLMEWTNFEMWCVIRNTKQNTAEHFTRVSDPIDRIVWKISSGAFYSWLLSIRSSLSFHSWCSRNATSAEQHRFNSSTPFRSTHQSSHAQINASVMSKTRCVFLGTDYFCLCIEIVFTAMIDPIQINRWRRRHRHHHQNFPSHSKNSVKLSSRTMRATCSQRKHCSIRRCLRTSHVVRFRLRRHRTVVELILAHVICI